MRYVAENIHSSLLGKEHSLQVFHLMTLFFSFFNVNFDFLELGIQKTNMKHENGFEKVSSRMNIYRNKLKK